MLKSTHTITTTWSDGPGDEIEIKHKPYDPEDDPNEPDGDDITAISSGSSMIIVTAADLPRIIKLLELGL